MAPFMPRQDAVADRVDRARPPYLLSLPGSFGIEQAVIAAVIAGLLVWLV